MIKRKEQTYLLNFILQVLITCSVLISCVPTAPSNQRDITSTEGESNVEDDVANTDIKYDITGNFFEYSGVEFTSTFQVNTDFKESLLYKGNSINQYIKNNPSEVYCGIFKFSSLGANSNLVLVGLPKTKYNISSSTFERYISFNFNPAFKSTNSAFCDNSNIRSSANIITASYETKDLCPTCNGTASTTSQVQIFTSSGVYNNSFDPNNLKLKVSFTSTSDNSTSCSSNTACASQGLDCCLDGQCVNDGTLKRTYAPSDGVIYDQYIAAIIDVSNNPNSPNVISKYRDFYYVCSEVDYDDDDDVIDDSLTPQEQAQQEFLKLKYLYECANPIDGEMSVCTKTIENPSTGTLYGPGADDRDFSNTYTGTLGFTDTIHEIIYQGISLYSNGVFTNSATDLTLFGTNDDVDNASSITLNKSEDENNKFKDLIIRYRIDGSCERESANVAKCYKTYIQNSNKGSTTDHFPANQQFNIPLYLDSNRRIVVEVDGIDIAEDDGNDPNDSWRLIPGAPSYIEFGSTMDIKIGQEVKIRYYVNLGNDNVLQSKEDALVEIGQLCGCPNADCNLQEVLDDDNNVVNYECKLTPPTLPKPPLQQEILVSAKSTPHRHFDFTGVERAEIGAGDIIDNPTYEQEGTLFEYTNSDHLLPNNLSNDIGFNEIYGSYTYVSSSAKPAKLVHVEVGSTYDISSVGGNFSTCYNCGTDYYSNLAKLFPENITYGGGGYLPDISTSSKLNTTQYRGDNLQFGRACFVPATMLPWSHTTQSDTPTQRKRRLEAQHFLYANGYNRDWYGFDYGSLIGSFDGVRWFSIGTKRRIKAKTNRLYLAINASFGDLTLENTYQVLVQDSNINAGSEYPTTDYETDGADCQRQHSCETDSDCASTLGWEYACENISQLSSPYPKFDANAMEIANDQVIERLISINGPYSGNSKRCVYRGRGATCKANYRNEANPKLHACSASNYCETNLSSANVFNTKINRFGKSVILRNADINATTTVSTHTNLSPTLGTPFEYLGSETLPAAVRNTFQSLDTPVEGICLPGRQNDGTITDIEALGSTQVTDLEKSEPTNHLGLTKQSTTPSSDFYSYCPVLDTDGDMIHYDPTKYNLTTDSNVSLLSRSQNLSSKALDIILEEGNVAESEKVTIDFSVDDLVVDRAVYNANSCLRAPGATCFSDLECSANALITKSLRSLDSLGSTNIYELLFWKEELVCSQPAKFGDTDFDLNKNRCCREVDRIITLPSVDTASVAQTDDSLRSGARVDVINLIGTDTNVASTNTMRYSRNVSYEYEKNGNSNNPNDYPHLIVAQADENIPTIDNILKQYKTLDAALSKTCCSENWIRNFNKDSSGGGHEWRPESLQTVDVTNFKCINYIGPNEGCADPDDQSTCDAISVSKIAADEVLNWAGELELTGIPNVALKEAVTCNQNTSGIPGFITDSTPEYNDGTTDYYQANVESNYTELKKVFSPDEFSCCMPAGTEMDETASASECCTGYINPTNRKCALRNYTDTTVYLNRYVSSEANAIDDSKFDSRTGYLKDVATTMQVACELDLCASGVVATGVIYGKYRYRDAPIGAQNGEIVRLMENTSDDNISGRVDYMRDGLKYNTHVYCIPPEIAGDLQSLDVQVRDCNAF